jgi:hypothetical protein
MRFDEADRIARQVAADVSVQQRGLPEVASRVVWGTLGYRGAPAETRFAIRDPTSLPYDLLVPEGAERRRRVGRFIRSTDWDDVTSGTDADALLAGDYWTLLARTRKSISLPRPAARVSHVGVGVAPGDHPQSWKVAVRAWSRDDYESPPLELIRRLPESERDLRITGVIRCLQQGPGGADARVRPLVAGCSIGHHRVEAGTLGAFVKGPNGSLHVLSNNHVLVEGNQRTDDDSIIQPALSDRGAMPQDRVGALVDYHPLQLRDNLVDAAIATIDDSSLPGDLALRGIGLVNGHRLNAEIPGWLQQRPEVRKVGRSSGLTVGTARAALLRNLPVKYGSTTRWFGPVIEVDGEDGSFSQPGDSGSVAVDTDGKAAGLLFAGDDEASYLCPIESVLALLHISF